MTDCFYIVVPTYPTTLSCVLNAKSPRRIYIDDNNNQSSHAGSYATMTITLPECSTVPLGTTFEFNFDGINNNLILVIRTFAIHATVVTLNGWPGGALATKAWVTNVHSYNHSLIPSNGPGWGLHWMGESSFAQDVFPDY